MQIKMFYSHRIEIEIFSSYTPDNTCPNYKGKLNTKTFVVVKCTVFSDFVTYDS